MGKTPRQEYLEGCELDADEMYGSDISHTTTGFIRSVNKDEKEKKKYLTQYSVQQGVNYRPTSQTAPKLPPGLYSVNEDQQGLYFKKNDIDMSELIRFDDSMANTIIDEFALFWTKKELYQERGEIHKRGFMLWGPPGGGKTSTVSFIMKDFINDGNVIFKFSGNLMGMIQNFRHIEPNRKVMIIMEDVDAYIVDSYAEQAVLDMLDGTVQHSNTIIIATTNYPERLPDRIINRPSRFDRVEYIGTPTESHRKLYIKTKSRTLKTKDITKWAKLTDGFTLAHVKELILSVEVFGLDFDETLERLNKMRKKMESSSDYGKEMRGKKDVGGFGFNGK
mgnify:FL=1